MIRFALLALPLLEIAGFILVGKAIGVVPTLGLVLLGVVLGTLLIRSAGLGVFRQAQMETAAGRHPSPSIVKGFLSVLAGVLLIVPGFLSDAFAILLLLPPVQASAWSFLKNRVRFAGSFGGARKSQPQTRVIDLDPSDYAARPNPGSPWADKPNGT